MGCRTMTATLAMVAALMVAVLPAWSAVIRVDPGGGGDALTLQEGLDAAADGDTVLVAPGIYTGPLNRDLSLGSLDVTLRSEAGASSTIIDCEGAGRALDIQGSGSQVVTVDGFTIENGSAECGGGIRCSDCVLDLIGTTVRNCDASDRGGGMHCVDSAVAVLSCLFEGNHSIIGGGGVSCDGSTTLELHAVDILHNETDGNGGGLHGAAVSTDCVLILSNVAAGDGGGLYDCSGGLHNVRIYENSADRGGGIFSFTGGLHFTELIWNTATLGGGFYSCTAMLNWVGISKNYAEGGGGIYECTGGWMNHVVIGCNEAGALGGGAFYSCDIELTNVTIADNVAPLGSAIRFGSPSLVEAVIAFNLGDENTFDELTAPSFINCCIYGNDTGSVVPGSQRDNLYVDPLFCYDSDICWCSRFGYHWDSPCRAENNAMGLDLGACSGSCGPSPVGSEMTWGAVKSMFR